MPRLLHVFRNTPLGRETTLQAFDVCSRLGLAPFVHIPHERRFLLYFENAAVQVDLDGTYLSSPASAHDHVLEIAAPFGLEVSFVEPTDFTAEALPNIQTSFDLMCCPRSISDVSSKIGLGQIGSRVRRIVQNAPFPVLIPSPVFKPWSSIAVMVGGSANALKALRLAIHVSAASGAPLDVFTWEETGRDRAALERIVEAEGLADAIAHRVREWRFFTGDSFDDDLFAVPHDALVVLGAYGHGLVKELLFGSTMERVQSSATNNLLVVGPLAEIRPFGETTLRR